MFAYYDDFDGQKIKDAIQRIDETANRIATGINTVNTRFINNEELKAAQEAEILAQQQRQTVIKNAFIYGSVILLAVLIIIYFVKRK